MNKCFKCLKPIEEGEFVCDKKGCQEAFKEFSRKLKRDKRLNYNKFDTKTKEKLSDLEILVEKELTKKEGEDGREENNQVGIKQL